MRVVDFVHLVVVVDFVVFVGGGDEPGAQPVLFVLPWFYQD